MFRSLITVHITQNKELYPGRDKEFHFTFCHSVKIERSFDNMTTTATVTLPRNVKYQDKNIYEGENPLFMRGDLIELKAGYQPNNTRRFKGYISRISNDVPMEIKCEDAMFLLKQKIVKKISEEKIKLQDLLELIVGNFIPYSAIDCNIGAIRVKEASVGVILDKLRDNYGLYSQIDLNGNLLVGTPFYEPKKTVTFLFEKTIIAEDSDLQYVRSDDIKVRIKGVLINGNKQTETFFGDSDGDLRTVFLMESTDAELKRICEARLKEYKYDGYVGRFKTFLDPQVLPGDIANINSYKYPERNGAYIIKSVETMFGVDGGFQNIELERRVS